jgi:hypothetical protein
VEEQNAVVLMQFSDPRNSMHRMLEVATNEWIIGFPEKEIDNLHVHCVKH